MNVIFPCILFVILSTVLARGDERTPGRIGKRYPSEKKVYQDEQTGRDVVALTTSPAEDDKIYQTHPSWTADGKHIVFRSDRAGSGQVFAVNPTSGEIVQITASPEGHSGVVCLSRKRNAFLTVAGDRVLLVNLDRILSEKTLRDLDDASRQVGILPPGAKLTGLPSWDAVEELLYLGLEWPDDPAAKRWSIHALDLRSGEYSEVVRQGFRINHVQANPTVPGLVMYAQESGGDTPQRMWIVRRDGRENRPFYRETYDEWVTHEVWWDETRALFTIWPKNEEMRKKPHGITSVNLEGESRVHCQFPFWHVSGARGCHWAIGDTFVGEIFHVDLNTGQRMLLTQGHRLKKQGAHPHQTLRPDGRAVLFVSHHFGSADLFLVDVPADGEPRRCP